MNARPPGASLGVLILCLGCNSAQQPIVPADTSQALPESEPAHLSLTATPQQTLGQFRIDFDLAGLRADVTPVASPREAQTRPQGYIYDTDIRPFASTDLLKVTALGFTSEGNLEVRYSHAHPMPAPDLNAPIVGKNRADLGYTGRLVYFVAGPTQTFFADTDRTTLNPSAIPSADGYLKPGALLSQADDIAFPYTLLCDEALNNRNVPNGGNMNGNYQEGFGGWQRFNIFNGNINYGWTGFDYIHAGQEIANRFVIAREYFADQNFSLDVALLVKYTVPGGGSTRDHRMPFDPADTTEFTYRLPYSALDISKLELASDQLVFAGNPDQSAGLRNASPRLGRPRQANQKTPT